MRLPLRKTMGLFRQLWFWFLLLITFNQIAILVSYYLLIAQPTANTITTVFMGLADALDGAISPDDAESFGVIKDRWVSNNHIMVISGPPNNLETKPYYPALWVIESKLRADWGERVQFGYSTIPERTLWLQFLNEVRPFSIGIPLGDRLKAQAAMLLVIGLIFLLTIVMAWVIATRLGRPLHDIGVVARKLGRGENVDLIRFVGSAPPEIANLTEALQQMQCEIQQMQREREQFLEGIAHDLRTPLSRMRVAVEFPEISSTKLANGLHEDIEEMRAILDQFLELSRLDSEKSEPFIEGDICQFMHEITDKYIRADAPITLIAKEICRINYKPIAFKRLFYNLIDNALRHGEGSVLIQIENNGKKARISVINRYGKNAEENSLTRALRWVGGGLQSGLGAAIIRRLADVHSVVPEINSSGVDNFTVSLEFDLVSR